MDNMEKTSNSSSPTLHELDNQAKERVLKNVFNLLRRPEQLDKLPMLIKRVKSKKTGIDTLLAAANKDEMNAKELGKVWKH